MEMKRVGHNRVSSAHTLYIYEKNKNESNYWYILIICIAVRHSTGKYVGGNDKE